jgi:thioredoxin-dependent peroxiredoxin
MVELRKRKAAPEPAQVLPQKKKSDSAKKAVDKSAVASDAGDQQVKAQNGVATLIVGEEVPAEVLGVEVETHTGEAVTLKKMLADSSNGVVLFTYPKASTPGCECVQLTCRVILLLFGSGLNFPVDLLRSVLTF